MKNFKKRFAGVAVFAMLASTVPTAVLGAANYSNELEGAYEYAYDIGITTQSPIDNANMFGSLLRSHMAKMMSNYAVEVLGLTPDTTKECNFTDVANETAELQGYIEEACQLGLMGVGITEFNPRGIVTRAQFGTVLSRALYGDMYNDGDPYYADHLAALQEAGIMNNISNPNAPEVRGYVMLMMQRADEGAETPAICETPENVLACSLGLDTCPEECVEDVIVTKGNLDVSMISSEGGDVPYGVSSLPVVTYELTADEDIDLNGVTIQQLGYGSDLTLDGAALFINGERVTKIKDINLDDELTLGFTNSYVIKAGSSVEIAVHASVLNSSGVNGQQFKIKLVSVDSSAEDVEYDSNLTSDTFKVVNTANAVLEWDDLAAVEDPKLGTENADLFEFKLINNNTTDQDITLNSITLLGSKDYADYVEDLALVVDDEVIATSEMNGKYLSFNIEDGYVIEADKLPTFTIKGDVIGGAKKTIDFTVEYDMDIVAVGDKYDVAVGITRTDDNTPSGCTIKAGKVTIERTNPADLNFVGNKTNVLLGAFTITNNAGGALTLNNFRLKFSTDVSAILDSVKVKYGSTTASSTELVGSTTLFTGDDEKSIGSKLIVYVYADTVNTGMNGKSFYMTLDGISIEETVDGEDLLAEDITMPGKWATMNGKDGSLNLTQVTLGAKGYSKGTEDIDALSFKLKAGSSYGVKVKNLTFTASGGVVNTNTVASATLYKGTTAIPATVRSGSILVTQDVSLTAGETATFMLKIDLAANPTLTGGFSYYLTTGNVEAEDTSEDRNPTYANGSTAMGRNITVKDVGEVTFDYDSSIANNKYTKSILAGTTSTVAEYNLYSTYEEVNIKTARVTFDKAVQDAISDVELRYNGEVVASNPTWTTNKIATFTDIDEFDTLTDEAAFLVKVITNPKDQTVGATVQGAKISKVELENTLGKDSGSEVTITDSSASNVFDIVPVTIVTSLGLTTTTSVEVVATAARGANTMPDSNTSAKAYISGVLLTLDGNNGGLNIVTIRDDANTVLGTWSALSGTENGTQTISFTGVLATTTLKVSVTHTASIDNPSYTLSLNGVAYYTNVDGTGTVLSDRAATAKTLISK